MTHLLEQHGDQTSFVSARKDAWHRLGTVLPDCFDAQTALETAHLANWNVRKEPMQTVSGLAIPDKFANVRTNPYTGETDVLGVTGNQYVPIQNEDHVEFLNTLTDESGAHFETAGSLKGGKEVFVTMKLPESMKIAGVDEVETYIAALNSHDGSSSFRLLVTPVRVVCANTQAAAIKQARSSFAIRHMASGAKRIGEAREALGLTFQYLAGFQEEAERMINETCTLQEFSKIVDQITGVVSVANSARANTSIATDRENLFYAFDQSPTVQDIKGTRWGAYQAVTEWADHMFPVRGNDKETARALRTASGSNDKLKIMAWSQLATV